MSGLRPTLGHSEADSLNELHFCFFVNRKIRLDYERLTLIVVNS